MSEIICHITPTSRVVLVERNEPNAFVHGRTFAYREHDARDGGKNITNTYYFKEAPWELAAKKLGQFIWMEFN